MCGSKVNEKLESILKQINMKTYHTRILGHAITAVLRRKFVAIIDYVRK